MTALLALSYLLLGAAPSGVVVEAVAASSAAAKAGVAPGDVLLSWSRAATPSEPRPAEGTIESPFDIGDLRTEQFPRGPLTLRGRRGEEAMTWTLPRELSLGISARPNADPALQAINQEAVDLLAAKKPAEAGERFRAAAAEARRRGERLLTVWFLFRAGESYARARSWPEADALYEEVIREAGDQLPPMVLARLQQGWADAYYAREDWPSVERHIRRAIEHERQREEDSLSIASLTSYLGVSAMQRMELAAAEDHLRHVVRVVAARAPGSLFHANVIHNLGAALTTRGELLAAEDHYRRALAIKEALQPGSDQVAAENLNLGRLALDRGALDEAEAYARKGLAIREKAGPDSAQVANSLDTLGEVALARGALADAHEHLQRALAIREKTASGTGSVAWTLRSLGRLERERGNLAAAEGHYRRSLAIVQKLQPGTTHEAEAHHGLGLVHRQAGRREEALAEIQQALDALESQRGRLGGADESRAAFFAKYAAYYHDAMDAFLEQGRPAEALHVLERSRARSLLGLLAERPLVFSADLMPELRQERTAADAEYNRVQGELAALDASRDGAKIDELLARLREVRARQEDVAGRIRQAAPGFASLQYPQPLDLAGIRAALDPGTVFLAYAVGKERTLLFAVEPAEAAGPGLSVFSLAVGESALREKVAAFRARVQRPIESARPALTAQAAELYDLLLRPAEPRLLGSRRLLVSPDGPLHSLPLAALVRKEGSKSSYLVEWKPLVVVPSATVHAEIKKARRESGSGRLVAFGNPRYPGPRKGADEALRDAEVRAVIGRSAPLRALPATRDEVEGIASQFRGRVQRYLGAEATEARAKSTGPQAAYLHFACHAALDERSPLNSGVALTIPEKAGEGEENGLLQAWEIFDRMRIDARLVTLSACNTALGQEVGGEGLLGLRRAFHYAGARSVLASLWAISDRSTAVLMKRFYGQVVAGRSLDEALRAAQVHLIRTPGLSHPFRWAAFQLSGDWR